MIEIVNLTPDVYRISLNKTVVYEYYERPYDEYLDGKLPEEL